MSVNFAFAVGLYSTNHCYFHKNFLLWIYCFKCKELLYLQKSVDYEQEFYP
ncbi:hypothetical protein IMSAG192_00516 [Muribaculaceae bacterium]|nr:hypothetical protein IMSAG192_00516 [Muribaculaceae bacterium]